MADDTRVTEEQKAQLSKRRGQAATQIVDPAERQRFISAQGDAETVNKGQLPVARAHKMSEEAGLMGYKRGTAYVPKTGPAILHKGEAVIPANKNSMGLAESALAHNDREAPAKPEKKKVKSVHVRKAHKGGFIAETHFTNSLAHPMQEHALSTMDALKEHMQESLGGGSEGGAEQASGSSQEEGQE